MENEFKYKPCSYTTHSHLKQSHMGLLLLSMNCLELKNISLFKWIKALGLQLY